MTTEKSEVRRFIRLAKEAGAKMFRLYDGEEWVRFHDDTADATTSEDEILAQANSTGQDVLHCLDADGKRLGYVVLIWGNDPKGEEIIADAGCNEWMDPLLDKHMNSFKSD